MTEGAKARLDTIQYASGERMRTRGKEGNGVFFVLGALSGLLGFVPLAVSANLARRHPSTGTLSFGLYALGGVFVSLIVLIAAAVLCATVARDDIVGFIAAEGIVFLGATIVYVVRRNQVFKRKRDEEE